MRIALAIAALELKQAFSYWSSIRCEIEKVKSDAGFLDTYMCLEEDEWI